MFGSDRTPAVMAILSDMDGEVTALESNLAKARYHKRCLIHELLTERTIVL